MHARMFVRVHANGARLHMHACLRAHTLTLTCTHTDKETRAHAGTVRGSARVTSPKRTERKRNSQFIKDADVDWPAPCWEVFDQSLELSGVIIVDGPLDIVDDLQMPCCF
jgi:hypothetical protein